MLSRLVAVFRRSRVPTPSADAGAEAKNQLTVEYMREWEDRLGPERVRLANSYLAANGWPPLSAPPIWVWAMAFREAEKVMPYPQPTVH